MRFCIGHFLFGCCIILLCACPVAVPSTDQGGPDGGPDKDGKVDCQVADQYVFDPDFPTHDVGCMTRLVSKTSSGKQFNGESFHPSISRGGSVVVFTSWATNLVPRKTKHVYAHNLNNGKTELVSRNGGGEPGNEDSEISRWAVNKDGRFVVFNSRSTNLTAQKTTTRMIFLHDRITGTNRIVSVGIGGLASDICSWATVSDNGNYVSFSSYASNLVVGDTNGFGDIFVRDLKAGTTIRASVANDGSGCNKGNFAEHQISGNGQRVVFLSGCQLTKEPLSPSVLHAVYVRDLVKKRTYLVSRTDDGTIVPGANPSINADGKLVTFQRPNNGNIYVAEVELGKGTRVSSTTTGQAVPYISSCWFPAISGNGKYVTYCSSNGKIVTGDTNSSHDVFLVDLKVKKTVRVSVAANGVQGVNGSGILGMRSGVADSGRVAFESLFSNLVGPTDRWGWDIFVRPGCP